MKPFFTPDDFRYKLFKGIDTCVSEQACEIANQKLNTLIKSWPVVYKFNQSWLSLKGTDGTHQARLAFIEEIKREPCKHEPKPLRCRKVNAETGEVSYEGYICIYCNVELKAEWREVEK